MPLHIIGAGFGRTGTTSIKQVLEELGFGRCYHMREMIAHSGHARIWLDAYAGKPVDWDRLFDGYASIVDWPGAYFYRELMAAYPEARVLLTVRDPERWHRSMTNTIKTESDGIPRWALWPLPPVRQMFAVLDRVVWEGTFHGRFADKAHALAVYEQHIEAVKATVPADRLLVYSVREGWEPLCRFLDVPVPDRPFPHTNDPEQRQSLLRRRWAIALAAVAVELGAVALAGWLVVRAVRAFRG